MELFCIGEKTFCELFSFAGADSIICSDPQQAAACILSRQSKNEIIILSDIFFSQQNRDLEELINSSTRIIMPVPSPAAGAAADSRSTLRRLLGGV
jgi:vacuolar-type H+-ATPase subunit F/Vma7